MTDTSLLLTLHISTYTTYIVLDIYFSSFKVLILSFLIFFYITLFQADTAFQSRYT